MRSFLLSCVLGLGMAGILVACSFSVETPEHFGTVDGKAKDVQADVSPADLVAEDFGPDAPPPDCVNDGDCPAAEGQCFVARCVAGKCSDEPTKGADCEDDNACTQGDTCNINGDCKPGAVKECSPSGDPCIAMECVPETGQCEGFAVPGCFECAGFAEEFFVGEVECCEGLVQVPFCFGEEACPDGEQCCVCEEDMAICLSCGDTVCQDPEDACNCEADCGSPLEQCGDLGGECFDEFCPPDYAGVAVGACGPTQVCCMKETFPCLSGGDVGFNQAGDFCCEPFDPIFFVEDPEGNCKPDENMFVCAKCGDQECQAEWEENACNCPQDCKDVGCTADGGCPDGKTCFKGQCIYCSLSEICNGLDDDCDGDVDEDCQEVCFAEICGDEQDNDCDGTIDEAVCVKDWCPAQLPPVYLKAPLHKLASNPADFVGQPVAVSGRAAPGEGGCIGVPPCLWDLNLEEQGILPKMIQVGPSEEYKDVFCISDNAIPMPEVCTPLAKNKTYIVWGVWDKSENTSGGFALSLHGFCKP